MAFSSSQASSTKNASDTLPFHKQTQDVPATSSALLLAMVACSSVNHDEVPSCTPNTSTLQSQRAHGVDISDSGAEDEISGTNTVTDFSDVGSEPEEEINLANWQDVGARLALVLRNHVPEDADSLASTPRSHRRNRCVAGVHGILSSDKFKSFQNWQDVGSRIAAALREVDASDAESEEVGSRIAKVLRGSGTRRKGQSRVESDAESEAVSSRAAGTAPMSESEAESDVSNRGAVRDWSESEEACSRMRDSESEMPNSDVCSRIDAALLDPLNQGLYAPGAMYYEPDDEPEEEPFNVHNWKSIGSRIAMILAETDTTDDDDEEFNEVRTVLGDAMLSTNSGGSVTPPEPFTDDTSSAISTTADATGSDTDP